MDSSTTDTGQTDRRSQQSGIEPDPDSEETSPNQHAVIADATYSKATFIEPKNKS